MNRLTCLNRNVLRAIAQTTSKFQQVNLFSTLQTDYQKRMRKEKRETYDSGYQSESGSKEEIKVYLLLFS